MSANPIPVRTPVRTLLIGVMLSVLAGCGSADEKPGGVTRDEAAALDAAAEMLDKRELPDLPEAKVPAQGAPAPAAS